MTWIDQDSFPLRTLLALSLSFSISNYLSSFFRAATDNFNYPLDRTGRTFFEKISEIPTNLGYSVKWLVEKRREMEDARDESIPFDFR